MARSGIFLRTIVTPDLGLLSITDLIEFKKKPIKSVVGVLYNNILTTRHQQRLILLHLTVHSMMFSSASSFSPFTHHQGGGGFFPSSSSSVGIAGQKRECTWDAGAPAFPPPTSVSSPYGYQVMPPSCPPPTLYPSPHNAQVSCPYTNNQYEGHQSGKRMRYEPSPSCISQSGLFIVNPTSFSSSSSSSSTPSPAIINTHSSFPTPPQTPRSPFTAYGPQASFFPSASSSIFPTAIHHQQQQPPLQQQQPVANTRPPTSNKLAQSWFYQQGHNNHNRANHNPTKVVSFAPEPIRQCWYCRVATTSSNSDANTEPVKILTCSQCSKDCCQARCMMSCDDCNSICCTGCMMVDYSQTYERKLCYDCYYAMSQ